MSKTGVILTLLSTTTVVLWATCVDQMRYRMYIYSNITSLITFAQGRHVITWADDALSKRQYCTSICTREENCRFFAVYEGYCTYLSYDTPIGEPSSVTFMADDVLYGKSDVCMLASCYTTIHGSIASWYLARLMCVIDGGVLAELETPAEQRFVQAIMSEPNRTIAWIGGTDRFSEGTFVWDTNETEPIGHTAWVPGHPEVNNNDTLDYISVEADGWHLRANGDYEYICEYPNNL